VHPVIGGGPQRSVVQQLPQAARVAVSAGTIEERWRQLLRLLEQGLMSEARAGSTGSLLHLFLQTKEELLIWQELT